MSRGDGWEAVILLDRLRYTGPLFPEDPARMTISDAVNARIWRFDPWYRLHRLLPVPLRRRLAKTEGVDRLVHHLRNLSIAARMVVRSSLLSCPR